MIFLNIVDLALPLTNPVLKFLVILIIILAAPIFLNKFKIPHILGLIIAGAVIGPNGFNVLLRDSSIILSGTAGLLYIMFLAGLEIDIAEFKKNSKKSLIFGLYTFTIPMVLGIITGLYLLNFSVLTSVLLASMFASHTLIAYPILSKLGVTKNRAVNIAVGGTMITDTLALLVLAVIVGMSTGEVNSIFWTKLSISIVAFVLTIALIFPIIGRWFLKRYEDNVSQYIFVLVMVFLGAVLAEAAGIEAIIGAFFAGLALNRLIPATSPLMNRIEFVGNAVFIPFFLIGVGMLVDYRVFFQDFETIKVAAIMTIVATFAKYMAALLAQKTFRFSADERRLIFGLSNAQAAATLAAVLVGYNVIIGETAGGEPIRLLNEAVLNGTIIMILITCTIASFVAQKGGKNISLQGSSDTDGDITENRERILIPVNNPETIEELINLSTIIKSKENKNGLYALNILSNEKDNESSSKAKKILERAVFTASATDTQLNQLLRYDINITNGITGVIKEQNITDLVMGLHLSKNISESFLGKLTDDILSKCNITTFVYKPYQPISTIRKHIIIVPPNAEKEIGFPFWLSKIWNIPKNTGSKLVFYANEATIKIIREIKSKHPIEADFQIFKDWNEFLIISRDIKNDDNLIVVLSRIHKPSYHEIMANIPQYLNKFFQTNSYILIYPMQFGVTDYGTIDLNNPSLLEPIERLDEIGKNITKLFKRK
ncbi:MAG: sodium:proton antiporter [Bacteroidetes bacterium GWF2_41_61]|nr:MAG: sodium:proton antiporter [Bacteroidetes bacterium GWE2_40_15]OFY26529.1 MAG: sodium:proton antiporter [Bacteroidetes bacterium GWF2_41_61]HBG24545.1 sodium:proton antiporter [Rikenellaceae bacterium]HBZ26229.1 sodium:proton antiporter [Rikenellaceae bacterium]